ncbi:ECF RNA polymerase sigma factor SigE [Aquisphaera giovannonii]|uniref:ECF RNA polymerase sigma factor SigE n=1 Tax=Aquisphaera giovannonii TaxID=406548 RepID=A0A5B9VYV8_9BACT|nr:sigma-70 family RNA polymerase sigma factor [Aquisphaera giovannonii]QEH33187.1 ECF RNA polymerase sigma factor SigE [Aquisphaera giovannonii]
MTRQAMAAESSRHIGVLFAAGAVGRDSDRELLERFLDRDHPADAHSAFEALARRHGPMVERVCRSILGDAADAEDACQATFLVLARRAASIRDRDALASWLFGVAVRVSRHLKVDAARRRAVEREAAESRSTVTGATQAGPVDGLHGVFDEVGRLPERYRAPIVLCYVEGKTHEQAARDLACPLRTLQTRLLRGKEKLRSRLVRRGLAPAAALAGLVALAGRQADAASDMLLEKLAERTARAVIKGTKADGATLVSSAAEEAARGVIGAMTRSALRRVIGLTGCVAACLGMAAIGLVAAGEIRKEPVRAVTGRVTDEAGKPIAGAGIWMPWTMVQTPAETAHATTDAEGQFTLSVPASWASRPIHEKSWIVWAHAPGHAIGCVSVYEILDGRPGPVELCLGGATDTSFRVQGPDGLPLAGVVVEPHHFKTPMAYNYLPHGLLAELRGVTDAAGVASLPGVPREGLFRVQAASKEHGIQRFRLVDRASEPARRTIVFRRAGRVEGRIVADRPEHARGLTVYLSTEGEANLNDPTGMPPEGAAEVVTGEDGRFSVPAIASGNLTIGCRVNPSWPVRPWWQKPIEVIPGATARADIPLVAAVKVRGSIRLNGSGKPIPGASVYVGNSGPAGHGETVTSDGEGRFDAYVLPGMLTMQIIAMKGNYAAVREDRRDPISVTSGTAVFDLPPLEAVPAVTIKGKLVRATGMPVAGATVAAIQDSLHHGHGKTNDHGEFTLGGVPEGPIDRYMALLEGDEPKWESLDVASRDPLVLRLDAHQADETASVPISGTVVDTRGTPVSDAAVLVIANLLGKPGPVAAAGTMSQKRQSLATDSQGRFHHLLPLTAGSTVRAFAVPQGYRIAGTREITSDGKSAADLGPLRVDRLRSVAGLVTDTAGKPIAGARVMNWGNPGPLTVVATGEDGRFELGGLPPAASRLLVEANGFRAHGHDVGPDASTVTMRLRREDQPPEGTIRPRGTGLSREETVALARRVIEPLRESILDGHDPDLLGRGLEVLTKIDPSDAMRRCLANESPWNHNAVRIAAVHSIMASQPEDAAAILPTITNNFWRGYTRFEVLDALPDDRGALRKSLLNEALLDARREGDPDTRASLLIKAAIRLLDLGEKDQAGKIVDEAVALVPIGGDPAPSPRRLQTILPMLARIDLKAALGRIPAAGDERELNDLRGAVARGIAASRPEEAERFLGLQTWNNSANDPVKVCVRMARADLARARRIATGIRLDVLRGLAFGRMADDLFSTDPAAARELLEEAFRTFPRVMERGFGGGGVWGPNAAANLAAALLPVVERVQPGRIAEYVERVRALRWYPRTVTDLTSTIPDTSDLDAMRSAAALAGQMAPYDRELALSIARPILTHLREPRTEIERKYLDFYAILPPLALADPRGVADLVEAIPEGGDTSHGQTRDVARRIVAEALATPDSGREALIRRCCMDLEVAERDE